MKTKSLIQEQKEIMYAKESLREGINNLMDKYNIEDSIFVLAQGSVKEAVRGYFSINEEYDNINEAARNCDINTMGIRVIDNETFQVGTIYRYLSDCPQDNRIFDIEKLSDVR